MGARPCRCVPKKEWFPDALIIKETPIRHHHGHHRDPYWPIELFAWWLSGRMHERRPVSHAKPREFTDPSIEACAQALAREVWADINQRRLAGEPWYVAREKALSPRLRTWSKSYGSKCAARAYDLVLGIDPRQASPEVVRAERDRITHVIVEAKIKRTGRPLNWLDRVCLRQWGVPF